MEGGLIFHNNRRLTAGTCSKKQYILQKSMAILMEDEFRGEVRRHRSSASPPLSLPAASDARECLMNAIAPLGQHLLVWGRQPSVGSHYYRCPVLHCLGNNGAGSMSVTVIFIYSMRNWTGHVPKTSVFSEISELFNKERNPVLILVYIYLTHC